MAINNSLGISAVGIISHDGEGGFLGRKITATDGISVENSNGVNGDLKLSITKATTTTFGTVKLVDQKDVIQRIADPSRVINLLGLESHLAIPYFWGYFIAKKTSIEFVNGYNLGKEHIVFKNGSYFVSKGSKKPSFKVTSAIFCNVWSSKEPEITCRYSADAGQSFTVNGIEKKGLQVKISLFLNASPYEGSDPINVQVFSLGHC